MRITRNAQETVAFIGHEDPTSPGGIKCEGTGFFIGHEGFGYFVTAAHLARSIDGQPFVIRVTRNDRAQLLISDPTIKWHYHPDPTVDIAVTPVLLPMEHGFSQKYIPPDMLVTDDTIAAGEDIGVGDLCYTVGLFRYVYGNQRNMPFVHAGNIAVLPPPGERIPVWDKASRQVQMVEAILIESGAIDGASGSPVFVRGGIGFGPLQTEAGTYKKAQLAEDAVSLLGLFQGAWFKPPDEALAQTVRPGLGDVVPVGVGIVVPAKKIIEVLNMPELKRVRDAAARASAAQPTSASTREIEPAAAPPATDDNPNHREDFMRLLNAAGKAKPPDEQTS